MNKFFYVIDVGGTNIKGAVIDEFDKIIIKEVIKTDLNDKKTLAANIIELINMISKKTSFDINLSSGLGISIPGLIDDKKGVVCAWKRYGIINYNVVEELKKNISVPIKIGNDANLACLGELNIGEGINYNSFIFLTIGTGIGGDFVVDKKPLSLLNCFSGEYGHIQISSKEEFTCACGEKNCFEEMASTRALINKIKKEMIKNPKMKIWEKYNLENLNGEAIFEYLDVDKNIKKVFDNFVFDLGRGIVNIVNILMPEVVVIGGAISNQGEKLLNPLEKYVNNHIYAKGFRYIKIIKAKLGNDAGLFGAKYLFKQ